MSKLRFYIMGIMMTTQKILQIGKGQEKVPSVGLPHLVAMKLPGPFTAQVVAAGVIAAALLSSNGPLREAYLYMSPLAASLYGFHLLPNIPLVRHRVLAGLGGMSVLALGYHQIRRTHPSCSYIPPAQELALITGASSGIGLEIAKELGRRGYGLVLVARREGKLKQLVEEIRATGVVNNKKKKQQHQPSLPPIHVVPADLSKPGEAQRLYDRVVREKRLNISMLVANAAVGYTDDFVNVPLDKVDELVNLNVLSLTKMTRLFTYDMVARGRGRLMTVSSIAGAAPGPLVSIYSASKSFVTSFTLALQHELESRGVSVTCLIPGATFTEFSATSQSHQALAFKVPGVAMPADRVAKAGVAGFLRGDTVVVPGLINKLYLLGTHILPPKLLRKVTELAWTNSPI